MHKDRIQGRILHEVHGSLHGPYHRTAKTFCLLFHLFSPSVKPTAACRALLADFCTEYATPLLKNFQWWLPSHTSNANWNLAYLLLLCLPLHSSHLIPSFCSTPHSLHLSKSQLCALFHAVETSEPTLLAVHSQHSLKPQIHNCRAYRFFSWTYRNFLNLSKKCGSC